MLVDQEDDAHGLGLAQPPDAAHKLPEGEQTILCLVTDDGGKADQVDAGFDLFGVGDEHVDVGQMLGDPAFAFSGGERVGQDDGTDARRAQQPLQVGLDVTRTGLAHTKNQLATLADLVAGEADEGLFFGTEPNNRRQHKRRFAGLVEFGLFVTLHQGRVHHEGHAFAVGRPMHGLLTKGGVGAAEAILQPDGEHSLGTLTREAVGVPTDPGLDDLIQGGVEQLVLRTALTVQIETVDLLVVSG